MKGKFEKSRLSTPENYYSKHLKLLGRGEERTAICPFHNDKKPSLSINMNTGAYYCHACGAKGKDVLSFEMAYCKSAFKEAAIKLGAWSEESSTHYAKYRPQHKKRFDKEEQINVRAVELYKSGTEVPHNNAYLIKKGLSKTYGVKFCPNKQAIMVPLRRGKQIVSLQYIFKNGDKRFLHGKMAEGSYFIHGSIVDNKVYLTEGWATAISIFEATGNCVAVSFGKNRLREVAQALEYDLAGQYPFIEIVVWADNDFEKETNNGVQKANEAASSVTHGTVVVPVFDSKDEGQGFSDFNDIHRLYGLETVKRYEASGYKPIPLNGVDLICASSIKPEPISWLWKNWLAAGKLHLIAGMAGTGKTTIALSLASILTVGGKWPDESQCNTLNKKVLIWSGEDDVEDTLVPRLLAAGAGMDQIFFISGRENGKKRPFSPVSDMAELLRKVKNLGNVGLIIIDPIVSAVRGDSNKNSDVRNALQPIVDLAAETKAAIIGITHLSKGGEGRNPLEQVTGSLAFGAMARIVLGTAKSNENDESKGAYTFLRIKSNISRTGDGFYYDFKQTDISISDVQTTEASQIAWRGNATGSASQLMGQGNDHNKNDSSLEEAKSFLVLTLKDGPIPSAELLELANNAGISKRTCERARKELGIKPYRDGNQAGSPWKCELPRKFTQQFEDRQDRQDLRSNNLGDLGDLHERSANLNRESSTKTLVNNNDGSFEYGDI